MKNELMKLSTIIEDKDRDIEGLHEQLNASLVGRSTDCTSDVEFPIIRPEEISNSIITQADESSSLKADIPDTKKAEPTGT